MKSTTYEKTIGNTTFEVISECSPNATESLVHKLERLICRYGAVSESVAESEITMKIPAKIA